MGTGGFETRPYPSSSHPRTTDSRRGLIDRGAGHWNWNDGGRSEPRTSGKTDSLMQENVTFGNGRGERLAGVLHLPRETVNGFGVILCHGMESSKESLKLIHLGDSLSRAGFTVLRFDFTGAGESSGEFECITCTRHVEDLEAAHGLLKERGLGQAGVIGSSMGGTTAMMYAGGAGGVAAVVTLAAPIDPRQLIERDFPPKAMALWRAQGFIEFDGHRLNTDFLEEAMTIDVAEAVARITCPVLVIHGDADATVPVAQGRALHAALPGEKELCILPGADHRFTREEDREAALGRAEDWVFRHLRRPAA